MPNYLLLGAGFSRNWGGWLANEVRSDLAMRLEAHPYLAELLNRHRNFEDALRQIQTEFVTSRNTNLAAERLCTFQYALTATFDEMNREMGRRQFDFHNDMESSVGAYLTKFDAIFTLNQDLLLERHYLTLHMILSRSQGKVAGGEIPGMKPTAPSQPYGDDTPFHTRWHQMDQPFVLSANMQPYFKLHGSTNWLSPNGEQLIVMGSDKHSTIMRHPILNWYAEKFLEALSKLGARLTVIGYGFRDQHINLTLQQGWEKSHFPMMIVGPDGREILRKVNPTYSKLYLPGPLEKIHTVDSTRGLGDTFGPNGQLELRKLYRFLYPT
jgi:hypothetical protein